MSSRLWRMSSCVPQMYSQVWRTSESQKCYPSSLVLENFVISHRCHPVIPGPKCHPGSVDCHPASGEFYPVSASHKYYPSSPVINFVWRPTNVILHPLNVILRPVTPNVIPCTANIIPHPVSFILHLHPKSVIFCPRS